MKGIMIGLSCLLLTVTAWSETNQTDQTRTQSRDQDRTRTELRLKEQTRDQIRSQDCENLMVQARNRVRTQAEYQENLEFMLSYALRNQVRNAEELDMVSKFYQENRKDVNGTAREKRNTLMVKAEAQVKSKMMNNGTVQSQVREKNNFGNTVQYRAEIHGKNMNKNPGEAEQIKKRRVANTGNRR